EGAVHRSGQPERFQHRAVKVKDVPVERIQRTNWTVGETVDDLQLQLLAVEHADDASATLGTEIEGQEFFRGGHGPCPLYFPPRPRFGGEGRQSVSAPSLYTAFPPRTNAGRRNDPSRKMIPLRGAAMTSDVPSPPRTEAGSRRARVLYDGQCPLC